MRENLSQFVCTKKILAIGTALFLMLGMVVSVSADTTVLDKTAQVALGEKLYNDANLSHNANQSCATCHNPGPIAPQVVGSFIDDRDPVAALIAAGWPFHLRYHKDPIRSCLGAEIHRVPLMLHLAPHLGLMKLPVYMLAGNSGMAVK